MIKELKRIYISIVALVLAILVPGFSLSAQDPLSNEETRGIIELIQEVQTPWESVELNGKLKMDGLPVTPSVKIYMEKGSRIDISIRAPFVGEVGRMQADGDSVLLVNKMKKYYWSGPTSELLARYPGGLELIQSVLLGRTVIFGEGSIDTGMTSLLNVYEDEESGWLLMPKPKYQADGARYGYIISEEGLTDTLVAERDGSDDFIQIDYLRKSGDKYDLEIQVAAGKKEIEARLQFDAPKWDAAPMGQIKIDSKYTPVTIKEFLKKLL